MLGGIDDKVRQWSFGRESRIGCHRITSHEIAAAIGGHADFVTQGHTDSKGSILGDVVGVGDGRKVVV